MDINLTELIAILVIGIVVGGVVVFAFFNRQSPKHVSKAFTEALEELKKHLKTERAEVLEELKERNKTEREIENTYIKSAHETMKELVNTSKESVDTFQKAQSKTTDKILLEVGILKESAVTLANQTQKLSTVLSSTKGTGDYGEETLKRIVEFGGMTEHCHFYTQKTLNSEEIDKKKARPDLVVVLPSIDKTERHMPVDAKTSIEKFKLIHEAKDESTRKNCLDNYVGALKKHIRELSGKEYSDYFEGTPELVVMFIPTEGMFSEALREDPGLIKYAIERNILLASPITLISLLRMLAHGWRQVTLTEKAQQVHVSSKALFDAVKVYATHLKGIRDGLTKAVNSFGDAVGSWETRVHPRGVKLLDLDISTDSEEVLKLEKVEKDIREIDPSKT